jgi:glycerol-3-phosphate dehydrogenase
MKRATVADLLATRFDVIVIGGGINGAAIARDAAMRGMTVALLERDDLASGTSAWSSRLIHGGLRYLEHGEIGLVRESLLERERLLHNAPHLVTPLPTLLPVYRGARRGPRVIRAGMIAYDALSLHKSMPRHHLLGREAVLEEIPDLNPEGLRGGTRYFDAQATWPERLVIENAESAWRHGALVGTRYAVTGITADGAVITGVRVRDLVSGEVSNVRGRIVVNVAGPWVDAVMSGGGTAAVRSRLIGGTKGSHLAVPRWAGAPGDAVYFEAKRDGRPILVIPWHGMILVGSTDLRFEGDVDDISATDDEIAYLLDEVNHLFRGRSLTPDDVRFSYAGVRPLPFTRVGSTASITRRHVIHDHAPQRRGLYSIVGGKLTTHRSLAEETVNRVVVALGREARSSTQAAPLPYAPEGTLPELRSAMQADQPTIRISAEDQTRLISIYGAAALDIVRCARESPESTSLLMAEVRHAVESEMALSLTDLLMRRMMTGFDWLPGDPRIEQAAETMGAVLGWTPDETQRQIADHVHWTRRLRPHPA